MAILEEYKKGVKPVDEVAAYKSMDVITAWSMILKDKNATVRSSSLVKTRLLSALAVLVVLAVLLLLTLLSLLAFSSLPSIPSIALRESPNTSAISFLIRLHNYNSTGVCNQTITQAQNTQYQLTFTTKTRVTITL